MKEPTQANAIGELKRELALRQALYPKWVSQGKLSAVSADWRIKCLELAIQLLQS